MKKFTDFYNAWWFLNDHPYFNHPKYNDNWFTECYSIEVVKVNPKTECIDDDQSKNIKTRIWIEAGPHTLWTDATEISGEDFYGPSHDIKLDCGGKTFEEAIINLANKVKRIYGSIKKNETDSTKSWLKFCKEIGAKKATKKQIKDIKNDK